MMHIIPAYIHAYVQVAQIQLISRRHKYTEVMTSDAALLEWITGEL